MGILKIEQEDIDRAVAEFNENMNHFTTCCILYQAAKRSGIPVVSVGLARIHLENGKFLKVDSAGYAICVMDGSLWKDVKPQEIEYYEVSKY